MLSLKDFSTESKSEDKARQYFSDRQDRQDKTMRYIFTRIS